jgi:hypothetical protein
MVSQGQQGSQGLWLTIGILIGIVLANLGLFGGVLIALGLIVLGYRRGYRIALIRHNSQHNDKENA